jgi:Methane oxygenase PmoA
MLVAAVAVADEPAAEPKTEPAIRFASEERQVRVYIGDLEVADYVFEDKEISRPYFAHVKTHAGKQVSRNHPPREGMDKLDHANMHPGIWLSFGDLNGHDYWRLKARTKHIRFLEPPIVEAGVGRFKVLNHYLATDSDAVVCSQECTIQVRKVQAGYLIAIASEFQATGVELRFGDQEEMGLGVRVATPLAVEKQLGGRILDSEGRINGEKVWGQTARWCDYAGPLDGSWVGMTVLTSPKNFQPCWSHARDYGFVAMNPFGLNAFTKAARQERVVHAGESLRLGYAVVVHESSQESSFNPQAAYEQFVTME